MRRIIFISTVLSQPRIIKRITSLRKEGFNVSVYAFERDKYKCNTLPSDIKVSILGKFNDGGEYIKKFGSLKSEIKHIIDNEGKDNVIYYSFGLLCAYFLSKYPVKYIYELSDLIYGYPRFDKIRFILKYIEKKVINKSAITVMTSAGFKNYFFKDKPVSNIIVQPNKLNSYFGKIERPPIKEFNSSAIKFAFVGAIRYPDTILRFAKVVGEFYPQHEFHFYGESGSTEHFKNEVKHFDNVIFHGSYKNPEDLAQIYRNIDIIVSAYHTTSINERIAEPNKLYEAIYFLKPIVVSSNTFLETQVNSYNCGHSIDCYSEEAIKKYINSISENEMEAIREKEMAIPAEELIDSPKDILEGINKIL